VLTWTEVHGQEDLVYQFPGRNIIRTCDPWALVHGIIGSNDHASERRVSTRRLTTGINSLLPGFQPGA
jgi:hypothetical protein